MRGAEGGSRGRAEELARLFKLKSLGGLALAGAAAVLLPPVGAAIATGIALGEGLGVIAGHTAEQHFRNKRAKNAEQR
jgi:hypothetical protein